ncbi:MAG: serine O-acetyltransferase [Gammaproteobacteria bacterium]|jgi:serine O-acetyltransferase
MNSSAIRLIDSANGDKAATPNGAERVDLAKIWQHIRAEATTATEREPILAEFLAEMVLNRNSFEDALAHTLAAKLRDDAVSGPRLREVIDAAYAAQPAITEAALADIRAVRERDPASESFSETLLYFKGFHALQAYRVGHFLWVGGRKDLALFFQSRISRVFAVDIHPAARIGVGIMIDHATSVVIGETAVVGDNVSILHEVTLGGTGKDSGDRHPKIGSGVLIGAGAKLLGNVNVGVGAKIGAGSVVLNDVSPHCTVAGIPAVVIGDTGCTEPSREMDHSFPI